MQELKINQGKYGMKKKGINTHPTVSNYVDAAIGAVYYCFIVCKKV